MAILNETELSKKQEKKLKEAKEKRYAIEIKMTSQLIILNAQRNAVKELETRYESLQKDQQRIEDEISEIYNEKESN